METEVFERVVLLHKDRVHSYARMMLRDPAEAQDVAQESLVRMWQNRRKIDAGAARPWLMRTVHNLCIDRIRKRKVRAELADGEAAMERQHDEAPGPERLAGSSELGRRILGALKTLSAADRAVVVMREVQGMPYDEIAAALGLPLGTLKARLHRARDRLRSSLSGVGVAP
jgi:RNA polymerase sigma-70 factor (ECF subfamily)